MTQTLDELPSFIRDMLASCPSDGIHFWGYNVARHLHWYMGEAAITELLRQKVQGARRSVSEREIKAWVKRSAAHAWRPPEEEKTESAQSTKRWPEREHRLLDDIVFKHPGLYDFWENSPVRYTDDDSHAEEIVDALFPGNPLLCCAASAEEFWTAPREDFRGKLVALQFIVSSAMSALTGKTKDDPPKISAHTLENTGPRQYLVVECDFSAESPEWAPHIARWVKSGITLADACAAVLWFLRDLGPLVLITSSGGKSLHGWFTCAGVDEEILRRFTAAAYRLGADLATYRNPSQFVRLPDGLRDNGKRQTVFYFNPALCVRPT